MSSHWPIWCEIVCERCSATTAGQFNRKLLHKVTMQNEALRQGWKIIADDWLCKGCIKKEKDNARFQG